LEEQLEALEADFPMIKKQIQQSTNPGANPPSSGNLTPKARLIEQYNDAEKRRDSPAMLSIMAEIKKIGK